eukprot:2622150-Amphidinium_carterae.1
MTTKTQVDTPNKAQHNIKGKSGVEYVLYTGLMNASASSLGELARSLVVDLGHLLRSASLLDAATHSSGQKKLE